MQPARGILSCSSCRQRKLRCDRGDPCRNCEIRGVACTYAPIPRGRVAVAAAQRQEDASNRQHLESRIRHLESLISDLASQTGTVSSRASGSGSVNGGHAPSQRSGRDGSESVASVASDRLVPGLANNGHGDHDGPAETKSGRMIEGSGQMVYIPQDHWATIHDEISSLREHFEFDVSLDQLAIREQVMPEQGLLLLEGLPVPESVEEVLEDLPSRLIADRLVARYFNARERMVVLHSPSFLKVYQEFWTTYDKFMAADTPSSPTVSLPPPAWISLLFSVLLLGAVLCRIAGEPLPEGMDETFIPRFQRRAGECLVMSNFATKPGKHTLEALLLHGHSEFFRRPDAKTGVWVLGGVATRLALRMGYHRDPSNYPQISVFEGEIRRRMWAHMIQLDMLASYQVGLPSMLQARHCDVRPPRNIFDEEFGPDCKVLPPSRPETEMTPVTYPIVKGRILEVFGPIFDRTTLAQRGPDDLEITLALDKKLTSAWSSIPTQLRLSAPEDSLMIAPNVLIRQYNLEILTQKARCLLHRHLMTKSFNDTTGTYAYSRKMCLTSAMTLLKHQAEILTEVRPGGRLNFTDKWFLTSLEHHDFLLAAMVVCLELSSRRREEKLQASWMATGQGGQIHIEHTYTAEQLIEALRKSLNFWTLMKDKTHNAQQAYNILSVMLSKIGKSAQGSGESPRLSSIGQPASLNVDMSNTESSPGSVFEPPPMEFSYPGYDFEAPPLDPSFAANDRMNEIGAMLISPDLIDWETWDSHIQGGSGPGPQ